MSSNVKIDLITHDSKRDAYVLVVVEQGPWEEATADAELRRLQDRLYDVVDVAVDGHFASQYPDSRGKTVVIRLDCYDTPQDEVERFFHLFAEHIHASAEVQSAIVNRQNVKELEFEFNWCPLNS